MTYPVECSIGNFDNAGSRVCLTTVEAKHPLHESHVNDATSTLFGNSKVHQVDERDIFRDILEGIAQEEKEARKREEVGEVNQPLSGSRPPITCRTEEMGVDILEGEEEVNCHTHFRVILLNPRKDMKTADLTLL